jgi:hypothetical protein
MNSLVWTTFALLVVVAPALAVGVGVLFAPNRPRLVPQPVAAPVAVAPVAVAPVAVAPVAVPAVASTPQPQISVEPRPGGRWAVRKDGAARASRVFDRKQDAVDRARALAEREGAALVIQSEDVAA